LKNWKFSTKSIHIGNESDQQTGAVSAPIHLSSTYEQDGVGKDRGYDYSRAVNPTREKLEENLAALENGAAGAAFASGMAATAAVFQLLEPGDSILMSRNVYGGTYRLTETLLKDQGLKFDYIDMRAIDIIAQSITDDVKMVFIESPTNPLLELADISKIADICRANQCLLVVDNTFMSPYGQRPIDLGADIVIHSTTKFIGGHSDVVGGIVISNNAELMERINYFQKTAGAVPGPFDCWLLLRSSKTLALRVAKQFENALSIARWLNNRLDLKRVIYPGLDDHPQYELACKQQLDPDGNPVFGSIISIDFKTLEHRDRFLLKIQLLTLAESLGGVESLVSNPFHMTHGAVPENEKIAIGLTETLVRLSIGIEDVDDLIADLDQALN
jgi:cystathionine beta-lyase/cystathionine gamma-synthase